MRRERQAAPASSYKDLVLSYLQELNTPEVYADQGFQLW